MVGRQEIDTLPVLLLIASPDFSFRVGNRFSAALLGESSTESQWSAIVHPDDRKILLAHLESVFKEGEAVPVRVRIHAEDVYCGTFHIQSAPLRLPSGDVGLSYSIGTEVHQGSVDSSFIAAEKGINLPTIETRSVDPLLHSGLPWHLLDVQENERRRLARELHDEFGQLLTGLRLMLKTNPSSGGPEITTHLEEARSIVDELLDRTRQLSFDLRPAVLDQLGIVPALITLFERCTERTGILVDFRHQGLNRRLKTHLETCAYRIVQEALTNVARHSGAAGAVVRLRLEQRTLAISIRDRGRGFCLPQDSQGSESTGLRNMRERAELIGGKITIESIVGHGTTVFAELPTDAPASGISRSDIGF